MAVPQELGEVLAFNTVVYFLRTYLKKNTNPKRGGGRVVKGIHIVFTAVLFLFEKRETKCSLEAYDVI